jgi:dienelactone hydrolase
MKLCTTLFLCLLSPLLHAAIQERTIDYRAGATPLKGYLVWDDKVTGKRPGMLVVHEFWGLNDYARKRARMLAELGYTALAVDMYGEGKAFTHPKDATAAMQSVMQNSDLAKQRFIAAKELLQQQSSVDAGRIGAIGYCFGGTTVLNMAQAGIDLAAVVSFHGMLPPPAKTPGPVKARVLVENGAADSMVSAADIEAFGNGMQAAGAKYRFDNYPGAKHGFTNPAADAVAKQFDIPVAYHAEADQKSWQAMQQWLREAFSR